MTEIEIAWLAGLLEGEGSFGSYSKTTKVDLRVQLAMGDRDVVEKAAAIVGGAPIYTYDRKGQKGFRDHHKPQHKFQLRGYKAVRVMEAILPFMGERRSAKITALLKAWNEREKRTREHGLPAECHPEKPHYCQGLCRLCYSRLKYSRTKDNLNRKRREKMAAARMSLIDPSIPGEWHP